MRQHRIEVDEGRPKCGWPLQSADELESFTNDGWLIEWPEMNFLKRPCVTLVNGELLWSSYWACEVTKSLHTRQEEYSWFEDFTTRRAALQFSHWKFDITLLCPLYWKVRTSSRGQQGHSIRVRRNFDNFDVTFPCDIMIRCMRNSWCSTGKTFHLPS